MTSRSMKSSSDQASGWGRRRGTATRRWRLRRSCRSRSCARSSTRRTWMATRIGEERAAGDPAAEHVHRVMRTEIDAGRADAADGDERNGVGRHALPVVVRQPRHAEGGEAVEHGGAQRVARREVGDVVEADVVDVEHGRHQLAQADRVDRGEVLQRPLDREGEGAEGEEEGEVAPVRATGPGARAPRRRGPRTSRCRAH